MKSISKLVTRMAYCLPFLLNPSAFAEEDAWDRTVLPVQPKAFQGHIGLRTDESKLDFPKEITAPKGAPNVLLIMPDDVGFGAATAFGGPVPTPALDPEGTAPDFKNKSHTITAQVEIVEGNSDGMLVTQGGRFGGWGLYILNNTPVYTYNVANLERYEVKGKPLKPGKYTIQYKFKYDGGGAGKGGEGRLYVNKRKVAQNRIERTMGYRISLDETFDIGSDAGEPVTEDYHVPFDFKGTISRVDVKLDN